MSADLLREAAALMRGRAEVATSGPWSRAVVDGMGHAVHRGEHTTISLYSQRQDAEYIASMHPAVALAVADLLTVISWFPSSADPTDMEAAMHLARVYLGRADA